jgi:hypothetical protein
MATDTAVLELARRGSVPTPCALELTSPERFAKRQGFAPAARLSRLAGIPILRRAYERQEYFACDQVESVANIAAFVSPVASISSQAGAACPRI